MVTARTKTCKLQSKGRNGVAVVELAICLPILVILTLATIEACTMMWVQQSLKISAYEGARVGTVPEAKSENVAFQCSTLLDNQNVKSYTVTMDPADPRSLESGDYFTVTIDADFGANSLIGGWLYADNVLSRSVALRAH